MQKQASAVPVDVEKGAADNAEVIDVSDYNGKRRPSKKWRELIKKVWEVDPMICPRCGKPMKVIALIDEPGAIYDILSYLGLWDPVNEQTRPRAPPRQDSVAYSSPGEPHQCAIVYENASFDGIDELSQRRGSDHPL